MSAQPRPALSGPPLRPRYLGPRDERWLERLLELYSRFAGHRRSELREQLRLVSLDAPRWKWRMAIEVLERLVPDAEAPDISHSRVRERVFRAAAGGFASRTELLARVAAELEIGLEQIEQGLLCDLAGERKLGVVPSELTPSRLASLVNYELVTRIVKRARAVELTVAEKDAGLLARSAQKIGLICTFVRARGAAATLEVSGPLALFRRTALYARALASLLPRAMACSPFVLEAKCVSRHGEQACAFLIRSNDPIVTVRPESRTLRRVDARFVRDFARLGSAWRLVAEPPALLTTEGLLFPDFELTHADSCKRCLVEIVGFWTHHFLAEKLRHYRAAGAPQVILCVDERRSCSDAELPPLAQVVPYRTCIDAGRVLSLLEASS